MDACNLGCGSRSGSANSRSAVIAFNAAAGFAGYVGQVERPLPLLGGFALAALLGILLGSRLSEHVSGTALRRIFALFLAVVALGMIGEGLWP